jgi:N-acetylmuramoyl-L-alanine amidase
VQFAQIMRDQLAGSGIPPSTYVDSGGADPRADIAGLHLAQFPSVPRARQHEEPVRLSADEDAGASLEVRRRGRGGIAGLLRTQVRQVFESSVFDVGPHTGPRLAS